MWTDVVQAALLAVCGTAALLGSRRAYVVLALLARL